MNTAENNPLKKKVSVLTYGCRANQYDSAALENILNTNELDVVGPTSKADIYVVNSCAITEQAESDANQVIRKIKKDFPQAKIVLTGCSAQVSEKKHQHNNLIDWVVGNEFKSKIPHLINSDQKNESPHDRSGRFDSVFFQGGVLLPRHSRSFLKIQDGCSQFCSFCIVPYARGLNRSVSEDSVLASIKKLADEGVSEVVITGIHLGTYGKDLNPRSSLLNLLTRIEKERPIHRVRLSSIDPEEVSTELIDLLAGSSLFCEHVHLPLQSGDDDILKSMKRRYQASVYEKITHELSRRIPNLSIGTDVIVGFPGETMDQFERTKQLIESTPTTYVHVFPYSPRVGTKAMELTDSVTREEKRDRVAQLRELSEKKKQAFALSQVGSLQEVVVERSAKVPRGMSRNYLQIDLDYLPEQEGPVMVLVEELDQGVLKGRPVLGAPQAAYEV